MPQSPLDVTIGVNPSGYSQSLQQDNTNVLIASDGVFTYLNITTPTVVYAGVGRLAFVNVIVAGSTVGAVYDGSSTSGNTINNQLAAIPDTLGSYNISMPVVTGIVIVPGTGMTVAVSYDK
jgi:hypothetical protein